MKIITAPETFPSRIEIPGPSGVFLAGSIHMDEIENWQQGVIEDLGDFYSDEELIIFNPRRQDFDKKQEQSINNPYYKEQVNWELNALETAHYALMYFHPDTPAPITLLELGLHADSIAKLVVVCPDGFYRKGNVDIICDRFNLPLYDTLEDGIAKICTYINIDQHLV